MRLTTPRRMTLTDPAAHPLTFVGARGERFLLSVLDHDLIRVQGWPDGAPRLDRTWLVVDQDGEMPRQGRPRDDLSPFPLPPFTRDLHPDSLQIQTGSLRLAVHTGDFRIEWADAGGRIFAADLPDRPYAYDRAGRAILHTLVRREDEHYYGFGERSGPLDKRGRRMRMLNLDALGYDAEHGDPLYKHFPFYITFIPSLEIAYGLFYDNLATSIFDMGLEINAFRGDYRTYQAEDGDLDYYLLYGPTIEAVVEKFAALTGRPMLPPRWSLGYLGSTMAYTEAPDAQEQLKQFAALCAEYDIPCDMFHLSSGYTTGPDGRRYVFTWNRERIPDPAGMAADFHAAGLRLAANIKPYLLAEHPRYAELAARGGFVRDAEADTPAISHFWAGGAGEGGAGSYVDFTSTAGYAWWQEQVQAALLANGIDAVWNDNNEFEIWDDAARCAGFGRPLPIGLARPLQALLMGRASYHALLAHAPDLRPFVLSRSGCPGIQRYAQTWSGDNTTSWHTLRWNLPMGLGLSLCGAPNTGHDVGGFAGPLPGPELFLRWVQQGSFMPRFTIHSWKADGTVNEPWMYPDVLEQVRAAIHFRYRLRPYLYTLLVEAARTGHPIMRPLVYHYPHDPRTHTESFDFLLGPHLLVASVLEPGARARDVYLPSGADWCDWYTGAWHAGGQTVSAAAPLERLPLFAPAGGIVPLGNVPATNGTRAPNDTRQAWVFPAPGSGQGRLTLVEDDGESLAYRRGEYSEVTLSVITTPRRIGLAAEVGVHGYPLPYGEIEFVLPPGESRPVEAAGEKKQWTDADGRRHVAVPVR
ncbi:MAG: glycoside hydrolase family 31 protein [Anaerolineae bacterium]|nr:glycoside hydrolase family 31 protein [Anaerolineae bacterium]